MLKRRASGEVQAGSASSSAKKRQTSQQKPFEKQFLDVNFLQPIEAITKTGQGSVLMPNMYSLSVWLARRDEVFAFPNSATEKAVVDYKDPRYKWITRGQFLQVHERLEKMYKRRYDNEAHWLDAKKPAFGEQNDPIFVQHIEVPATSRVILIGDLHSSLTSLLNILHQLVEDHRAFVYDGGLTFKLVADYHIVFLGDIVDRGPYGVELLTLIALLQVENPDRVIVLNGNHEECSVLRRYGYGHEIKQKFEIKKGESLLPFIRYLHYLPSAVFLKMGTETYQLCHGALPNPKILEDAAQCQRLILTQTQQMPMRVNFALLRMVENVCGESGDVDNFKWGDFDGKRDGVRCNESRDPDCEDTADDPFYFGRDVVQRYLAYMGLNMIISGHQDISNFTALLPTTRADKRFEADANYSNVGLYRPAGYAGFGEDKERRHKTTYKPGVDFLAVNTASCLQSKGNRGLLYDCYLELYSPIKCGDMQYFLTDIYALARRLNIATVDAPVKGAMFAFKPLRKSQRQLCADINAEREKITSNMLNEFARVESIDLTDEERPMFVLTPPPSP